MFALTMLTMLSICKHKDASQSDNDNNNNCRFTCRTNDQMKTCFCKSKYKLYTDIHFNAAQWPFASCTLYTCSGIRRKYHLTAHSTIDGIIIIIVFFELNAKIQILIKIESNC